MASLKLSKQENPGEFQHNQLMSTHILSVINSITLSQNLNCTRFNGQQIKRPIVEYL